MSFLSTFESRWEARRKTRLATEAKHGDIVPIGGIGSATLAIIMLFTNWLYPDHDCDCDRHRGEGPATAPHK